MSSIRHADLFAFFSRLLPDEVLLYHSPLPPIRPYDPARTNFHANRVILSLTPTEGVYTALHEEPKRRCVLFLHRPFRLDRRRVPHGTLVLASHVQYDELLTTGYNPAFADEHLISSSPSDRLCIAGYKDNPERRIGLVGRLSSSVDAKKYAERLSQAFGGHEELYIPEALPSSEEVGQGSEEAPSPRPIQALASLNAFTPEVLARVSDSLSSLDIPPSDVICLTGAVREPGMEDAKRLGMSVLAVGHKRCEDWGMGYIERLLRKDFPHVELIRVDEEEEKPEKKPAMERKRPQDAGQNAERGQRGQGRQQPRQRQDRPRGQDGPRKPAPTIERDAAEVNETP